MIKNVVSIGIVLSFSLAVALATQSIPWGLQALAFAWVIRLGWRVYQIYRAMPQEWRFTISPFGSYPDHIDRGDRNLPVPVDRTNELTRQDRYLLGLAERIVRKIRDATNEANVVAFMRSQVDDLRRSAAAKYSKMLLDDIEGLAAEGAAGALLGIVATVSQSLLSGGASNAHFLGVGSAVLATIVAVTGRSELQREVNRRMERDACQVDRIQAELESNLVSRLRIQDQMQHKMLDMHLVEAAFTDQVRHLGIMAEELAASSATTTQLIDRVNGDLAPSLRQVVALLQALTGMKVAVSGAIELTPQLPPSVVSSAP